MLKKIAAIALSIVLIFSAVPFAYGETTENAVNPFEKEIKFLNSIGLLPANFSADAPMSRGAFAKMVTDLVYAELDLSEVHTTNFTDLQYGSDFYNSVAILEGLDVVKGNGANAFKPDNQISLQDALVIALKVMGYDPFVSTNGGYPAGYLYTGKLTGLSKSIENASNLDMKSAAKLVYNMLFISSVGVKAITDEGYELGIDYTSNFLVNHLNIVNYQAQIVNDGVISFDNDDITEDRIVIKDLSTGAFLNVECKDYSVSEYIGCYVEAFVKHNKETDKLELVSCTLNPNVEIFTVSSSDIVSATASSVEYEADAEKAINKKKAITTDAPVFIRNGIRLSQYSDADLKPQFGNLKFIDNNGDGLSEVVIITDISNNIVVNSVAEDGTAISCKDISTNSLDLSDKTKTYARAYKDGKIIKITDISADNIVSVAKAEKQKGGIQIYFLYVSANTAVAAIDSTNESELFINSIDSQYKLSDLYYVNHNKIFRLLEIGKSYTLRLDYFGEVAYIDGIKGSDVNYAYLLNVVQDGSFGELSVVAYTGLDAFSNYDVAASITIDGKSFKGITKAKLIELLNTGTDGEVKVIDDEAIIQAQTSIYPRPAIIKVNTKGEIYYIDTDAPTYTTDAYLENNDPYVLTTPEDNEGRYYRDTRIVVNAATGYGMVDGSFIVNDDTIIMMVPDVDRYEFPSSLSHTLANNYELPINNLSYYKIISLDQLNTYNRYDMQVYNIDPDSGLASLLVLRGYNDLDGANLPAYSTAKDPHVFLKKTKVYDSSSEDDDLYKIYYKTLTGEELSVLVNRNDIHKYYENLIFGGTYSDGDHTETVAPLAKGDLFWFREVDSKLKICGRVLDFSKINSVGSSSLLFDYNSSYYPYENRWGTYGMYVPFDSRESYGLVSYSQTYSMEFSIPLKITDDIIKLVRVEDQKDQIIIDEEHEGEIITSDDMDYTPVGGTFKDYFLGTSATAKISKPLYVSFAQAESKILVVEERKCNSASGKECDIVVRAGTLDDIKFAESETMEGYKYASKLYYYRQLGLPQNLIIYNIDFDNHDMLR